jgi:mannosyltransferase
VNGRAVAGQGTRGRVVAALLLGLAVLVGAIARVARIGSESLWGDESYAIAIAQRGFGGMLGLFTQEPNGLLYYLVVYPLARLDPGVTALRLPSAVVGVVAIVIVYWTGSQLADSRTGLVAAGLMALSPLAVEYSQQGRFYALAIVFATLSFGLLAKALKAEESRRWWIAYIVATAALSYCSTLGVLLMAGPQAVYVASFGFRAVRRWIFGLVGVLVRRPAKSSRCCVRCLAARSSWPLSPLP